MSAYGVSAPAAFGRFREVDVTSRRRPTSWRLVRRAAFALPFVVGAARAEDDPAFDAYTACFAEQMATNCLAGAPVADFTKAVATQCDATRRAYAASKATRLVAAHKSAPEKAAAEAERLIVQVDTAMTGEYRKCLGDPG